MAKVHDLTAVVARFLEPVHASASKFLEPVRDALTPLVRPLSRTWARLPLPVAFVLVVAVSVVALQGSASADTVAAAEAATLLASAQADAEAARARLGELVTGLEGVYPDPDRSGHGTGSDGDTGGGHGEAATGGDHGEQPAGAEHGSGDDKGEGDEHDSGDDWSYRDPTGPSRWARLSHSFAACEEGKAQSPVGLQSAEVVAKPLTANTLTFTAAAATVSVDHNRVVATGGFGGAKVNGIAYVAERVVVHTPAEHAVDDFTADAEVQIEMRSATGATAIVAVTVVGGAPNPAAASLAAAAVQGSKGPVPAGVLDVRSLLPASPSAYRYVGSVTSPPCTEGVTWTVMASPVQFSLDQISALKSVTGPNARPRAEVGKRTVVGGQLMP